MKRNTRLKRKQQLLAMGAIAISLIGVCIYCSGCTKSRAADWAQRSPVLKPTPASTTNQLNLSVSSDVVMDQPNQSTMLITQ